MRAATCATCWWSGWQPPRRRTTAAGRRSPRGTSLSRMPSLGSHLASAYGLADAPRLTRTSTPIAWSRTTWDRRRRTSACCCAWTASLTHFFELSEFEPAGLGGAHVRGAPGPPRRRPASNESTRAFVAGYVTHLLMDEHYIQSVYRRLLRRALPARGRPLRANVLDRALQYEMNRRELEDDAALDGNPHRHRRDSQAAIGRRRSSSRRAVAGVARLHARDHTTSARTGSASRA